MKNRSFNTFFVFDGLLLLYPGFWVLQGLGMLIYDGGDEVLLNLVIGAEVFLLL